MVDSEMWHLLSGADIVHVAASCAEIAQSGKKAGNVILEALSLSKILASKVKAADVFWNSCLRSRPLLGCQEQQTLSNPHYFPRFQAHVRAKSGISSSAAPVITCFRRVYDHFRWHFPGENSKS